MKKTLYTALFMLTIVLHSCQGFLEIEPALEVSDQMAINNVKGAEAAIIGAYNKLSSNNYQGVSYRFVVNLLSDNLRWVGNSPSNREFDVHEIFTTNSRVEELWNRIYETINIANNIIEAVPKLSDGDLQKKNTIRGEAYFIRALAYHDLLQLWANVPIVLKPTRSSTDALGIANAKPEDVRKQIIDDLDLATDLLPSDLNRNRASRYAVYALKSRLYLNANDWTKAASFATELIQKAELFNLVPSYANFYLTKNTSESIFEIDYTINNKNNYAINWLPGSKGGRREFLPTDDLVGLLNNPAIGGDRKSVLLLEAGIYYGNMNFKPATGIDQVYVFRLAEAYLNRAEALANLDHL